MALSTISTLQNPLPGGYLVRATLFDCAPSFIRLNRQFLTVGVQLIPAGLLALTLPILKESPVFLIKRGRVDEALKVLSYIRCLPEDHEYIEQDVEFVRRQLEAERSVTGNSQPTFKEFLKAAGKECFTKGIRNRFLLVFLMFMWQAWSGAAAINYYSPTIFRSIGLSDYTLWTGIYVRPSRSQYLSGIY